MQLASHNVTERGWFVRSSVAYVFALVGAFAAILPATCLSAPVSSEQARCAATRWTARGRRLGAKLGKDVAHVATHTTTNGMSFYAVKMQDGGTVFLSSDTEIAPVICFTSDDSDFSTLDPASPLWALLNRDLSERGKIVGSVAPRVMMSASATSPSQTKNEMLWADLLAESTSTNTVSRAFSSAIQTEGDVGDLRVAPLVKSKWSQSTANGKACYNYYTPNGSDESKFVAGSSGNEVCGCVATAMSQVMRYHKYPTASVASVTRTCGWGTAYNEEVELSLKTQGGTYDWDRMTLVPNGASGMTDANYQAIGKLTSDAGISVYMSYHMVTSAGRDGGSGAFSFDIALALKEVWGYKSAIHFDVRDVDQTDGSVERVEAFRKTLFANFDAGYPVCMGVPGHAIVADGYGFDSGMDYVHLNMGWSGTDNFWYNLPDVTEASASFTCVDSITYNIFPDKKPNYGIVSGRVTTGDGSAAPGASVQISNGGSIVGEAVSSATGVWGVVVPAGTYDIRVTSANGKQSGTLRSEVKSPVTQLVNWNSLGRRVPTVFAGDEFGNSWGNDIVLAGDSGGGDEPEEPTLTGIVVNGPSYVYNGTKVSYVCAGRYSDGTLRPVSPKSWVISNNTTIEGWWIFKTTTTHATLSAAGVLTADSAKTGMEVSATYVVNGKTYSGSKTVDVVASSAAPGNDLFARATAIDGTSGSAVVDSSEATDESGEPLLEFVPSAVGTVWWKWTAPSDGWAKFDTEGSSFDTVMGVYCGTTLAGLSKVSENNDRVAGETASECAFACVKGTTYYIAVGGWCGTRGSVRLGWRSWAAVSVPTAETFAYGGIDRRGVAAGEAYVLSGTSVARNAGDYLVTVTPKDGYCWTDGSTAPTNVTWSISRASLTVAATNATVIAGEEAFFGATYAGFVAGEDESVLEGCLEFNCAYEPQTGKAGETYAVTPTGLESDNYEIAYADGVLTVVPDMRLNPGDVVGVNVPPNPTPEQIEEAIGAVEIVIADPDAAKAGQADVVKKTGVYNAATGRVEVWLEIDCEAAAYVDPDRALAGVVEMLSEAASAEGVMEVSIRPEDLTKGLYYSVLGASDLGALVNLTGVSEGTRVLADGKPITLVTPRVSGALAFFRIVQNMTKKQP